MSDLHHAIGRYMPIRDFRDVLPIPRDQLRKRVDLSMQYPPDNLKIIGHQSLHSNEVEALCRRVPRHCIIPLICGRGHTGSQVKTRGVVTPGRGLTGL
jgi:hypothetical protein